MKSINKKEETEAESSHEQRKFTKNQLCGESNFDTFKRENLREDEELKVPSPAKRSLIGFVGVNGDERMRYETGFGYGGNRY
jgi:hypothetical protein